ncbi:hypothetical protein PTKIN_Ptkin14bG0136700 [Pterospermum kingtungense]
MKFGSWNVRGLNCAEKKRAVRSKMGGMRLDFFCLQETKIKEDSSRLQRWLWGNAQVSYEIVCSDGNAGGLISCWRNDFFTVERKVVSARFILLMGFIKRSDFRCGIGNIYAPNDEAERSLFFEEVSAIIGESDIPWCLARDFNVVRNTDEKIGLSVNQNAIDQFSEFIESLNFVDLLLVGGQFTWRSNRSSPTWCRLDRFLVDAEFLIAFPNLVQRVWPRSLSDHNLISLEEV